MSPKNEPSRTRENPSFEEEKMLQHLRKNPIMAEQLQSIMAQFEQELPIGSGEVESAHRHILQKRLKIPGAWWRLERAEEMAQIRALRANQRWNEFWEQKAA